MEAALSEGIYTSSSDMQQHTPPNNSKSPSFQPVVGQGLGLTPLPGSQLQQDRNHLQDLDLQGVGDFGGPYDLPTDHNLDLTEIDRLIRDGDLPGSLLSQDNLGEVYTNAPSLEPTENPVWSTDPPVPCRLTPSVLPESAVTSEPRYRPIAPKPTLGADNKRFLDDISIDEDNESDLSSAEGNKPAAKRQRVDQSMQPNFTRNSLPTPDQDPYFSKQRRHGFPSDTANSFIRFPVHNSVERQSDFTNRFSKLPSLAVELSGAPCITENTTSAPASLVTPKKGSNGNTVNVNTTYSRAPLSLPPHSTAPATPCLLADSDVPSFHRESSVDSLFDERENSPVANAASSSLNVENSPFAMPFITSSTGTPISDHLKRVCQIKDEDILLTQSREAAWFVRQRPRYISPYPQPGGALGYLPSTPSLHVRSIKAADTEIAARLEDYRKKVRSCMSDRAKLVEELQASAGRGKYQALKDQVKYLKRAATVRQKREKEAKREAERWQEQHKNVATAYNQLCADFHHLRYYAHSMQIQLQHVSQAREPRLLHSYAPVQHGMSSQVTGQLGKLAAPPTQAPAISPLDMIRPPTTSVPITPNTSSPATPVMVDLTGDEDTQADTRPKPSQPTEYTSVSEPGIGQKELLEKMRKKEYRWLGNNNHMHQRFAPSLSAPPQTQPQAMVKSASARSPDTATRNSARRGNTKATVSQSDQGQSQTQHTIVGLNATDAKKAASAMNLGNDLESPERHLNTPRTSPQVTTQQEDEDDFARVLEMALQNNG
ncbi:predicted protein [Uncinocarpus reesii 1704]|uniref:Uncharacterized protein n=1 Tax=Uncinocarpus reesii (strain UAMH 1704) TaxID=336963 RepID=C4JTJ8_UNCRE|nr:uncharacterized protein UREG_05787 [Uncinocarpus reesii 1704]EEP80945.1 predicted protein [Uncinocarpus reesii 1704]